MTGRQISFAETRKMYEAYLGGATMEAVGQRFRRSTSGIQKAFSRWGLPVRPSGGPMPARKKQGTRSDHLPNFETASGLPSAKGIVTSDRARDLAAAEGSRALLNAIHRYFENGGRA